MKFENYLKEKKDIVEKRLNELFIEIKKDIPEELYKSMGYSLFAGGKRLRPILVYAVTEAMGGDLDDALTIGGAIEFIHTYSLIHDDLPAMDDDDYRRGKLTNHKVFGEATAILAGDALLTEAFNILTCNRFFKSIDFKAILQITNYIAKAAGASGMVGGQILDMLSEKRTVNNVELEKIHLNKTAKLIAASLFAGARLSTDNKELLDKIEDFGINIGLCFQITDDILDVTGNFENLGKSVGSDEKKQKATFPLLYGLNESKKIAERLIKTATSKIDFLKEKGDALNSLAYFIMERVY